MKLLIMVLSSVRPEYMKLMLAQQRTWDSDKVDNVQTIYYNGYNMKCSDEYNMMHWKFKLALDAYWDYPWDMIFRTNSSTYVCKQKVYDFLKDKPKEKYYSGATGGNYHSGTGLIFTRDLAQLLRDEIDEHPNPAEDGVIAGIFHKHGYEQQEGPVRLHFNFAEDKILPADYYRCKSEKKLPNGELDREQDIIAFDALYKHFHR
jgi:hypothetical protein